MSETRNHRDTLQEEHNAAMSGVEHDCLHLSEGRYRSSQPWPIIVEHDPDGWIVSDEVVQRHGDGASREEAQESYADVLIHYLDLLFDSGDRLSPRMEQHRSLLEHYFTRA